MFSPLDIIDTRDAAKILKDPDTPLEWRRFIRELFYGFYIDPTFPDADDVSMIPEGAFVDYVRELTEDDLETIPSWLVIDWKATADAVAADYILTSAEINGESRWYYFHGV